jgi:DeoR/GlpR family transcriptional regulator of sugar metabolism
MLRFGGKPHMKLRKSDRQQQILSQFRASPSTRLGDLASMLQVSKETIRRDITEMSQKGLLSRTYGGAVASSLNYEPQMRDRMRINPAGRRRMGDLAASLVAGLPVIMIDSGSTMATVAERIAQAVPRTGKLEMTAITNGLQNVSILAENPSIRVIAAPGAYDDKEAALFGPMTLEFIGQFRTDALIIGAGGIGANGVMDANSDAAAVKRAMLRQASRTILVLDSNKFDYAQFETVCPLSQIDDLVSDAPPPDGLSAALAAAEVEVHIAAG